MGLKSVCVTDIFDLQIAALAACMNFKMTVRGLEENFGSEVQLATPMVCP